MTTETLEYLINHFFLPPKLPQGSDWTSSRHIEVLQYVLASIDGFILLIRDHTTDDNVLFAWNAVRRMVDWMISTRSQSSLNPIVLSNALLDMKPNETLCLHIVAQNAGVILRRLTEETTFEAFQASPPASEVTSTTGKLVITFPSMPRLAFPNNEQCITSFCRILAWLDRTEMSEATAKTNKAGSRVDEHREVAEIHYLTQMLGNILATATTSNVGDTANSTVYVTKRINDHVLWNNAELPWRRMPEWLVLRVALQTTLKAFKIKSDSPYGYKLFITFLLADVLKNACQTDSEISHELLHAMNVKIANRMWKLRDSVNEGPVFDFVFEQVERCRCIMQARWDQIQAKERSPVPFSPPSMEDILNSCHFNFPNCGEYLSRVYNRHSVLDIADATFDAPSFERKLCLNPLRNTGRSPPEPLSGTLDSHDFWLAVVDFERWITTRMERWQDGTDPSHQIEVLESYINGFISFIDRTKNPEQFSRLYLIILELWVALDKAAIRICSLLGKYSPELTIESFEPLLLPQLTQMRRLDQVERYILERHDEVKNQTSIFNFEVTKTCFAYQYYLNSYNMKILRNKIRDNAKSQRDSKVLEWERLRERFGELTRQSGQLPHTLSKHWCGYERHDTSSCKKCRLENEASALSIAVFEWPLPENPVGEGMVVFELTPPKWFSMWRTVTYNFAKVKGGSLGCTDLTVILSDYEPLRQYSTSDKTGITIASYLAKPWYRTHYAELKIRDANSESDVIKAHPLRYRFYTHNKTEWVTSFPAISIRNYCTPSLPAGIYSSLSWAINSTTHTSNMVIASQSDCHRSLTYQEWESFGHLRAGGRLQWRNILIEFLKGIGSFKDPTWFLLIRQAVWQVEARGDDAYRDFHTDLTDKSFALEALEVLSGHYDSICQNWQEGWTAMSLSVLACRIHSLNSDVEVRTATSDFLSRLRQTSWAWLKDVRDSYLRTTDPTAKDDLLFRLIQIATCCRSTYALELEELRILFMKDPIALEIFIASSIMIQTFLPGSLNNLPSTIRYIVQKDFLQAAEAFTCLMSREEPPDISVFSKAIRVYWEGFQPDPGTYKICHKSWLRCRTSVQNINDQPRFIHCNVLDGQLLVDGKTLGGLPKSILRNPLYKRIFPNRLIADIVPSTLRGMSYQLGNNVNGILEVHFQEGTELIIRVRDNGNNGATSEFVDDTKLTGDFPNDILRSTIVLYCDATESRCNSLKFYELSSGGWNGENPLLWEMEFSGNPLQDPQPMLMSIPEDHQVHLSKKCAVLSPNSELIDRLFVSILDRLETSTVELTAIWESNQDCLSSCSTSRLIIKLPRYSLTFFLNSSFRLECKELSNMLIAEIQAIDTLIGLRNKLILEHSRYPTVKKIIIPYGDVHCQSGGGQAFCRISPVVSNSRIRFFVYELDDVLRRLTSTETLASWYFLIYLHALTSYHISDPLTGRYGTEQALWMLSSSSSFAFMEPLKDSEPEILRNIHSITPERNYYPKHLTSMESVTWRSDIPILAQSDSFVPLVSAILEHNKDLEIFFNDSFDKDPPISECPDSLRRRSEIRTSRIVAPEFCHEPVIEDQVYEVRLTAPELATNVERLIETTASINSWRSSPKALPKLWTVFSSFSFPFMATVEPFDFLQVDHLLDPFVSPTDIWFGFFDKCCNADVKKKHYYDLLFTFSTLAYRSEATLVVLRLLLAMALHATTIGSEFYRVSSLVTLPVDQNFTPHSEGCTISRSQLKGLVTFRDFEAGLRLLSRKQAETSEAYENRCRQYYHKTCDEQRDELLDTVTSSTLPNPSFPVHPSRFSLIDLTNSKKMIKKKFCSWARNLLLYEYCTGLDELFQQISLPAPTEGDVTHWSAKQSRDFSIPSPRFTVHTLQTLIKSRPFDPHGEHTEKVTKSGVLTTRALVENLSSLPTSGNLLQIYCDDLSECTNALELEDPQNSVSLDSLRCILGPKSASDRLLSNAGLWPTIHPVSLLRQLTYPSRDALNECSPYWLSMITKFGETLRRNQFQNRKEQLRDHSNVAVNQHQGKEWKTSDHLDWLLLELDADISIRPVQVNIAKHMMFPTGGTNAVMQLNMGEGKSSVIMPMVATVLADGKRLVRVMVLKPLCAQMFQLLRQRICGLVNRRLYFFPFHRNVRLDAGKIKKISALFQKCAESAGVLLCQPEHVLSFRLIGLEALCSSKQSETLLEIQSWLDNRSRDILDESDELLSTRYQLIYTVGTPLPLDGQPHRWEITQRVFSLVHDIVPKLRDRHKHGLEVSETKFGRFPHLRLLTDECARDLEEQLVQEIIYEERLPWLLLRNYTAQDRKNAVDFITSPIICETKCAELKSAFPHNFPHLLLLRGLLAFRILVNVLKEKRWRVDYGLDLSRCLVAVPYRAKDYPSLRAEFGHPEVIIALTCLSYYYNGLRDEEIKRALVKLLQMDNPDLYYQEWIKDQLDDIPDHLRTLRGLNLEDAEQQHKFIFPRLRHIKSVIDFYLSQHVFPREAKEFPYKLTTNSWDLAMQKANVTTGFSGTNDHRYLLPLSIQQNDSPDQKHTNALVLEYILRPENRRVIKTGPNPSAITLLGLVVQRESQVLIDAGAQVLELDNAEVARTWLKLDNRKSIEAAVYCDMKDEVFKVISRTGRIGILQNSPYKVQLEKTLVYLDEARTRGTDFKFPLKSFAVVTLGPKLVKDKLVQACMRMRQLGRSHSVMFLASDEVVQKIQSCSPNVDPDDLDSSHVLRWTMHETILQLQNNMQHWGIQGLNYSDRRTAWENYLSNGSVEELLKTIKEQEAKTLEELYGMHRDFGVSSNSSHFQEIIQRCTLYGINLSSMNNIAEEQERELAHEKEQEREVERSTKVDPSTHAVDPALLDFLHNGTPRIDEFRTLADSLEYTSNISYLKQSAGKLFFKSREIRCTADFIKTIVLPVRPSRGAMNDFLRPVQWIMTSSLIQNFFCIISPFEANKLFPRIRRSNIVRLHCYTPRVSRHGKATEDLDRFLLSKMDSHGPNWTPNMIQELNIFSGQLFFKNEEAFQLVCRILGLHLGDVSSNLEGNIEVTGFIKDLNLRKCLGMVECNLKADPVHFLQDLFAWRCKGQGYLMTHMWKVLHGRGVEISDF